MSEKIDKSLTERRAIVIEATKNPVSFLRKNKDKGCHRGLIFLMKVRHELKQDVTYSIENPDSFFKEFYLANNADPAYYESLVSMLKEAEYTKDEINSAFFDWLQDEAVASKEIRIAIPLISTLSQNAVKKVFKDEN